MTDEETEIAKSLKQISTDLEAINNTIKEVCTESKEIETNEDREFQLQMLEAQISCNDVNSILTIAMAVGYSWAGTMVAVAQVQTEPLKSFLTIVAIISVICAIISSIELVIFQTRSVPRKIQKIRDNFAKAKEGKS